MKLKKYAYLQGLIQGALWFFFAGFVAGVIVFPFFNAEGKISPIAAACFMGAASYCGGLFMAVSGIVAARKDYFDNKLKFELKDPEAPAKLDPPRNPWLVAIREGTIQWPLFGAVTIALCFVILRGGLSQKLFGSFTGILCLLHGAMLVRRTCVRELLKLIAHPPKEPKPFSQYLWTEHLLGNGIANLIINFIFGYIVFHQGPKHPQALVTGNYFVFDSFGMCAVIIMGIGFGSALQAMTDIRAGRVISPTGKFPQPSLFVKIAAFPIMALLAPFVAKLLFVIVGMDQFSMLTAMVLKGIFACILAMLSPALAARWSAAPASPDVQPT